MTTSIEFPINRGYYPPVDRIIAIGDVHGDVDALRTCLIIAGLLGNNNTWTGGKTNLVQVGDILDRGEEERECFTPPHTAVQASAAGGAVHILLGNHEIMNADLDFGYVADSRSAWASWEL
eukprot:CAMPEP_0172151582 /NCGR_PEP_ID=MMETSP1050-20130122/312_1 /TAXON_ID=233186 /ORGANISM="Cryptomonas curvata, Strain CCAP979/52" /LENGTH=120 /DNA_ID=CAMNT_0012819709 /DNA_START=330 /DNA_END=690 /DNA_ORIENTATION=+